MKEMAVIQARTILMGFHSKLGLFKFALQRKDMNISLTCYNWKKMEALLTVILRHMQSTFKNLSEDLISKVPFEDLQTEDMCA